MQKNMRDSAEMKTHFYRECNIVLVYPSVCPPHYGLVFKQMHTVRLFPPSGRGGSRSIAPRSIAPGQKPPVFGHPGQTPPVKMPYAVKSPQGQMPPPGQTPPHPMTIVQ